MQKWLMEDMSQMIEHINFWGKESKSITFTVSYING